MSRKTKRSTGDNADVGLHMECDDEELSEAQKEYYCRYEREFSDVKQKLSEMVSLFGAEVIEKSSDQVYALQMTVPPSGVIPPLASLTASPNATIAMNRKQVTGNTTNIASGAMSTRAQSVSHSGFSLLVDPKSGQIVGTRSNTTPAAKAAGKAAAAPKQTAKQAAAAAVPVRVSPRVQTQRQPPLVATPMVPPMVSLPARAVRNVEAQPGPSRSSTVKRTVATAAAAKPTENNSVGGLMAGGNKPWKPTVAPVVDLTNDATGSRPAHGGNVPDSREIVFSKLSGKTFPSLVVTARPFMRNKDVSQTATNQSRTQLDAKVKAVLMYTPTKFTEWLIQQGYVRSEQSCSSHVTSDFVPVKLKLGMYSDVSKFPYSGGYVWISECCPSRFVSVFSGSIFEGAPHPPTVLLKLIYHWSCQTSVQNVVAWVKVDNFYVKNFFTNMRSVCTSALHEKYEKMGGLRKRVEVGVISLGTTSQDGNMRQVKVEVLGVMEPEGKMVRLRAVEPLQDGEKNFKRRFVKILEPLEQWVHKDSIIMTDFTVDKGTLHNMGFLSVHQVSVSESNAPANANRYSNCNVMEYLRRIVPRMFQNTLSLLSRQIIQQFLDELVWRERWGTMAFTCFDNILQHLSEQTKLESSDSLLTRLSRISADPFRHWNYAAHSAPAKATVPAQPPPMSEPIRTGIDMLPQSIRSVETPAPAAKAAAPKQRRKRAAAEPLPPPPPPARRLPQHHTNADGQTLLESYYYGTMEGDPNIVKKEFKSTGIIKCVLCPRRFSNNVLLGLHLVAHAKRPQGFDVSNIDDEHNCVYCLDAFISKPALKYHQETAHGKADRRGVLACRICDEMFSDRQALIGHMHRTHVATELPYECGVCTFRSSTHRDTVLHFHETHDGGEAMQCALCLKVFAMSVMGRPIDPNQSAYHTHVQKHLGTVAKRKCPRCQLEFISKAAMKEHAEADHKSFAGEPGVRMFVQTLGSGGVSCMMPLPAETASRLVVAKPAAAATARGKTTFGSTKIAVSVRVPAREKCLECGNAMVGREHYGSTLKCSKCRFTTCCAHAIGLHIATAHGKGSRKPVSKDIANLGRQMHCVCGFHTDVGNQLAKHMALCERKTAYVSQAAARQSTRATGSATFPPLVSLDDADDADARRWRGDFSAARGDSIDSQGEPQSMLNMLGLVRKPSNEDLAEPDAVSVSITAADTAEASTSAETSNVAASTSQDKPVAEEEKSEAISVIKENESPNEELDKDKVLSEDQVKDEGSPKDSVESETAAGKEPTASKTSPDDSNIVKEPEVAKDIPIVPDVENKPEPNDETAEEKGTILEKESNKIVDKEAAPADEIADEASPLADEATTVEEAAEAVASEVEKEAGGEGVVDMAASPAPDDPMVVSPVPMTEAMVSGTPELEDLIEAKTQPGIEEEMQVDSAAREDTKMEVDESMDMDTN